MTFTIGHDAEVFGKKPDGTVVSLIGKVGGTKEEPSPCAKGALQEDNVMAELNIEPASTSKDFIANTNRVMRELEERLAKYDLTPLIEPHAVLDINELNHMQAMESGCEPDYDAWLHCENPPVDLQVSNDRYAGGHFHFGVPFKDDPAKITKFIKYLDATFGVGMLVKHGISKRIGAYGRLGAHRPTPYGVEYRFIDNSWLKSDEDMKWAFDVCAWVIGRFSTLGSANPFVTKEEIQLAIDSNDIEMLRSIYNNHIHPKYAL